MNNTDFAYLLTTFLTTYLPGQKGFSPNTIMSYRDTFKLVLKYAQNIYKTPPEKMDFSAFTSDFVEGFLDWLESDQGNSRSTRNQRLAAIHSFTRFAVAKKPQYLYECHKILGVKSKRTAEGEVPHLTAECVKHILAAPDVSERFGRRDRVLLCLLYDSGARVQEICDLRVRDVRTQSPPTVTLTGKGNTSRVVPIMKETAGAVQKYLDENRMITSEKLDYPLFFNHQCGKLTRAGIAYILKKYADLARKNNPEIPMRISPHIMRRSKAMHLLQGGTNLIYIR